MVRHIVMYRLKDENKEENARQMKEKLEGLNGVPLKNDTYTAKI